MSQRGECMKTTLFLSRFCPANGRWPLSYLHLSLFLWGKNQEILVYTSTIQALITYSPGEYIIGQLFQIRGKSKLSEQYNLKNKDNRYSIGQVKQQEKQQQTLGSI